jgi:hypothetical protein
MREFRRQSAAREVEEENFRILRKLLEIKLID